MANGLGRLLLVHGDQATRSRIAAEFERLGCVVTSVADANEAAATLRQGRIDFVLLDAALPGAGDPDVLTRLGTRAFSGGTESPAPAAPGLPSDEGWMQARKLADALQTIILPVGIALSEEADFGRLLERILLEAKQVANADAGTLYLHEDADTLTWGIVLTDSLGVALGGTTGNAIPFKPLRLKLDDGTPNVHNVACCVALTGRSVKLADAYHAEEFDFSGTKAFDAANNYRTRSVLTVPLKNNKNEVIGVLQLINPLDARTGAVREFDAYEQLLIETLASQAAVALNSQLVMRRQAELLKLERDVQIGHDIQANFLPRNEDLPCPSGWQLVSCLHPARQVSGDFYDVMKMTRDRIGFLVADVCDKGVGAALFMALMRSLMRAYAQQFCEAMSGRGADGSQAPEEADATGLSGGSGLAVQKSVQLTNDYVANNHGALAMFATMFFGVLDPDTGLVVFVNGGHNPPMLVDPQGRIKARLEPTGPAVGMFGGASFGLEQVQIDPGDTLVCFTDGATDARDSANALFGEDRLLELVSQPAPSAQALLERLESALFAYIGKADQFDDITLMVIRRLPGGAA
jgi:phosphoserine phosphatase RsbU/P